MFDTSLPTNSRTQHVCAIILCCFVEVTAFAFLQSSQDLSDQSEAATGTCTLSVYTEYTIEVVILSQALLADMESLKST